MGGRQQAIVAAMGFVARFERAPGGFAQGRPATPLADLMGADGLDVLEQRAQMGGGGGRRAGLHAQHVESCIRGMAGPLVGGVKTDHMARVVDALRSLEQTPTRAVNG